LNQEQISIQHSAHTIQQKLNICSQEIMVWTISHWKVHTWDRYTNIQSWDGL